MAAPTKPRRPRILVVDDEEDVRFLLSHILSDAGFDAEGAEDGGPAIAKIKADPPDLVILDLMMPVVEGWAVLEHLHKKPGAPPVVLLTARGDHESLARGLREGIAAYVIKPFDIQMLVAACRRVLSERGQPTPEPAQERRQSPRCAVLAEALVQGQAGVPLARASLVSLGHGGARVVLDTPLDPGARVAVEIRTLDAGAPLKLDAEIRWRQEAAGRYATGLAFVGVSGDAARRLEELFPTPK